MYAGSQLGFGVGLRTVAPPGAGKTAAGRAVAVTGAVAVVVANPVAGAVAVVAAVVDAPAVVEATGSALRVAALSSPPSVVLEPLAALDGAPDAADPPDAVFALAGGAVPPVLGAVARGSAESAAEGAAPGRAGCAERRTSAYAPSATPMTASAHDTATTTHDLASMRRVAEAITDTSPAVCACAKTAELLGISPCT